MYSSVKYSRFEMCIRDRLNLLLDGDEISETAYGQSLIVDQLIEQYIRL